MLGLRDKKRLIFREIDDFQRHPIQGFNLSQTDSLDSRNISYLSNYMADGSAKYKTVIEWLVYVYNLEYFHSFSIKIKLLNFLRFLLFDFYCVFILKYIDLFKR